MESSNNISFVALQSGRAFIGTYDNVVGFCSATISFYADTTTTITLFQSQNKTADYGTVFNTVANTQFIQNVNLSAPYAYFIVRNNSVNDQTVLRFTVIYNMPYAPSSGGGVGTDVNISATNGNYLTSNGTGALDVQIKNTGLNPVPVSNAVLDGCVASNQVAVDVKATVPIPIQGAIAGGFLNLTASSQGSYTMLDVSTLIKNTGYVNQATAFLANVINENVFNIGSIGMKQVSLFGRVVDWNLVPVGTTANLYIFYSIDAGSGIYRTSLGAIQFTKVASPTTYEYDFSRDWATGAKILYLMCDQTIDIDVAYSFSS